MMHIYVSKIIIVASDNGLLGAIIWVIAGILLIGPLRITFCDM